MSEATPETAPVTPAEQTENGHTPVQPSAPLDGHTFASIDEILAAPDVRTETIWVPEWRSNVTLRGLSKAEHIDLKREATVGGQIDTDKLEILMLIEACVQPKFERHHFGQLAQKSVFVVDRLNRKILELSGLRNEDLAEMRRTFQN